MTRTTCLIAISVLLAGCPPTPYRTAVQTYEKGDFYRACGMWLEQLDEDIYETQPRRALDLYKMDCWRFQLDRAQEKMADGLYDKSIEEYEELFAFADRLDAVDLLDFSTEEARKELEDVKARKARARYEKGLSALEQGLFTKAVDHLTAVVEMEPDRPGLDQKLAEAYQQWAEENLRHHEYEESSAHYRAAFEHSGDQLHDAWAATIDAALGRYALDEGYCRKATTHLRRAYPLPFDPKLKELVPKAERCARIGVIVEPFDEVTNRETITATALGPMLADRLEIAFQTEGSEFISQLDPEALEVSAVDEEAPDRRFKVRGRITQVAVEKPPATSLDKTAEGEMTVICPQEVIDYEGYDAVCTEIFPIHYTDHEARLIVRLAGSVKVTDLSTGEQKTRPLELQLERVVQWADGFSVEKEGEKQTVILGDQAGEQTAKVDEAVRKKAHDPEPFPPDSEIASEAVAQLAQKGAQLILELVDREKELPSPPRLQVRPPILDAAQLMFAVPEKPDINFLPTTPVEAPPPGTEQPVNVRLPGREESTPQ